MRLMNNNKNKLNNNENCIFQLMQNAKAMCLAKIKKPTYFTIQLIFATIYGSHCTISANFYLYLQYF